MNSEGGREYLMGDSNYRFIFLFEEGMLNPLHVFEGNIIDILALKSLYYVLHIKSFQFHIIQFLVSFILFLLLYCNIFQRWHIEKQFPLMVLGVGGRINCLVGF
jgi:hypothetical protein